MINNFQQDICNNHPFSPDVCLRFQAGLSVDFSQLSGAELSDLDKFLSPRRRMEFAAGRVAARYCLAKLGGSSDWSLTNGQSGEPVWPDGYCGSISHSYGLASVAVAKSTSSLGIGVDLEYKHKLRDSKIFRRTLSATEQSWVYKNPDLSFIKGLQIFSAKEAIYKAFFSAFKVKLTFKDVEFKLEHRTSVTSHLVGTLCREINTAFPLGSEITCVQIEDSDYLLSAVQLDNF